MEAPVLRFLQDLVEEVEQFVPPVPGRSKLIRAIRKEIHTFGLIPSDLKEKASACSNFPHFKLITRLARAYGERVVGLLCRYRMPPATDFITGHSQSVSSTLDREVASKFCPTDVDDQLSKLTAHTGKMQTHSFSVHPLYLR
ncbi:hypothetical protein P879_10331 [Paragonimus westermani]|uniref:Uncharacterized protein n=1 Tax=Paragonimus westermani TaxID=34504 RepID=A0A8T0DBQ6_9TREM|nr:hypothetical protein P879_10331 [Paragonimus westermani]